MNAFTIGEKVKVTDLCTVREFIQEEGTVVGYRGSPFPYEVSLSTGITALFSEEEVERSTPEWTDQ